MRPETDPTVEPFRGVGVGRKTSRRGVSRPLQGRIDSDQGPRGVTMSREYSFYIETTTVSVFPVVLIESQR